MKGTLLGQSVSAPERYAPELLFAIPRSESRAGLVGSWQAGADDWTGWEISWLEPTGMPEAAVLQMRVPADSPNIIESKSLKLYLNSLNFTAFDNRQVLLETLHADIARCAGCPVSIDLLPVDASTLMPKTLPGDCLDLLLPAIVPETVDPSVLEVDSTGQQSLSVFTRLFRSCCPVTGQPDWASVHIEHRGAVLSPQSLLAYLLGYRRHQGFHEQCVEQIFDDLRNATGSDSLRVSARFLRRGGLEINPWRSRGEGFGPLPGREVRQ